MSFSTGPYALFTTLPPPGPSSIVSSRKVNFATKAYVTTDDGEFEAMDDVAQRVVLKCSFLVPDQKFISTRANAETVQNIRSALSTMTSRPEPEIELLSVSMAKTSQGTNQTLIEYRALLTGRKTTVVIP